ncbi:uncharacterized protein TRAVEDRAFT_46980 [Trametes versicolor FP-101664 SS1]|uniref:uncharacterized protein n=1 Tax=Trametes versicolor (strain FP-101664) TaxID=717944 RepID=UPI0004622AA6|nr:uncharacterized protein TRAVEDRAFT_46980 [Trametes versicolor FP-101664 SS1]EIW59679.1 hypothetical protein TRAVEDRAFT_46980 [Trametes versicolor FP-101664 SS1]
MFADVERAQALDFRRWRERKVTRDYTAEMLLLVQVHRPRGAPFGPLTWTTVIACNRLRHGDCPLAHCQSYMRSQLLFRWRRQCTFVMGYGDRMGFECAGIRR